jgi:N-acetylmuramic acid 6-phosphate (MurNAc-6-P) etherase
MPAIDNMGRGELQKLALNARRRLRNAELDKARIGMRAGAVVIGAGAAGVMGYVMGGLEKEAEGLTEAELAENDPTKVVGIDIDLGVGLLLTIGGVVMAGKASTRKFGTFVESAGTGILSGYAYTYGHSMGMEADEAT